MNMRNARGNNIISLQAALETVRCARKKLRNNLLIMRINICIAGREMGFFMSYLNEILISVGH